MQTCRDSAESWKTECRHNIHRSGCDNFIADAEITEILQVTGGCFLGILWIHEILSDLPFKVEWVGQSVVHIYIYISFLTKTRCSHFELSRFKSAFLQTRKLYCGKLWKFGWFVKAVRSLWNGICLMQHGPLVAEGTGQDARPDFIWFARGLCFLCVRYCKIHILQVRSDDNLKHQITSIHSIRSQNVFA